jgi:hypothetical protein
MESDFLSRHDKIVQSVKSSGRCLGQCWAEWQYYIEFIAGYFSLRGVGNPVVVEIGTMDNAQSLFYGLLGADHIGIDINHNRRAPATIIADSRAPDTLDKLKVRLAGRPIDLLFLDGNHTYDYVRYEFETYGPLVLHIIAFHDLFCTNAEGVEVHRFWRELCEAGSGRMFMTFHKHRLEDRTGVWDGHEMGIGLILKGGTP